MCFAPQPEPQVLIKSYETDTPFRLHMLAGGLMAQRDKDTVTEMPRYLGISLLHVCLSKFCPAQASATTYLLDYTYLSRHLLHLSRDEPGHVAQQASPQPPGATLSRAHVQYSSLRLTRIHTHNEQMAYGDPVYTRCLSVSPHLPPYIEAGQTSVHPPLATPFLRIPGRSPYLEVAIQSNPFLNSQPPYLDARILYCIA